MAIDRRLLAGLAVAGLAVTLVSCSGPSKSPEPEAPVAPAPESEVSAAPDSAEARLKQMAESWQAYKQQFIQADGRVIDREARDRTVSEGQAYALLRAVMADDPATFAVVLNWSENNLGVQAEGGRPHQLWAWQWGKDDAGQWGILDPNFASDADLDAATALILAARRWNQPQYLDLAQAKLADLWALSTLAVPNYQPSEDRSTQLGFGDRYFLPGPREAFQPTPNQVYLNPSYLAPYAFRLFSQVDPGHDWLSLVDSSYDVLTESAEVSAVGLPSDWVALDLATGRYSAVAPSTGLRSRYGFDAYRVWWRVALDASLAQEPRAAAYLDEHLPPLVGRWQAAGQIPAEIGLEGNALVDYDAPAQYGMLYPALQQVAPEVAAQVFSQALWPIYRGGIWGADTAYYTQNLIWLGLYPLSALESLDWQIDSADQDFAES
ncbi:MAG: glycosyl hydrolase family 8 [Elainellaceae cyanobacterium]